LTEAHAKGKIFSQSRWLLQRISDTLRNEFGDKITVSSIQPAKEGDYFLFLNWFDQEAA
jgi:NADP-dependent 3-hydroxy acid dehydrogenase YdfG